MNGIVIRPRHLVIALAAAPFLAFGAYIAWLVVPIIVSEVVPEVVRAMQGI
jgi:hypothetical protein